MHTTSTDTTAISEQIMLYSKVLRCVFDFEFFFNKNGLPYIAQVDQINSGRLPAFSQ